MKYLTLLFLLGIWEDIPKHNYSYDRSLSKTSNVHEATHFINASMIKTNTYGIWCNNKIYIFERPGFKKKEIIIPRELRFEKYDNYITRNAYEDYPFYIIDELSAYINGAVCSTEYTKNTNSVTDISAILEMSIYATCLIKTMENKSPKQLESNLDKLKELLIEGEKVFQHGKKYYPHHTIEKMLEVLKVHPYYANMEELIGDKCFQ